MERDRQQAVTVQNAAISTHTLTWSVTLMTIANRRLCNHFNSHAHVERDDVVLCVGKVEKISTHTLTWSVTDDIIDVDANEEISTHTLTWSVTTAAETYQTSMVISTHTLTWSVTC